MTKFKLICIEHSERDKNEIIYPLQKSKQPVIIIQLKKKGIISRINFIKKGIKEVKNNTILIHDFWPEQFLLEYFFKPFLKYKIILKIKGNPLQELKDKINLLEKEGFPFLAFRKKIAYHIIIFALKKADLLLTVSDDLKNRLSYINKNIKTVHIPCNEKNFRKKDYKKEVKEVKVLAVTDFKYQRKIAGIGEFLDKNKDFLLKENLSITIAGEGPFLTEFKEKYQNYSNIHFLGYCKDIDKLYSKYDLFVHFSYLDGYPNTVLEAQASRLPVVVNRCCGMVEQVTPGVNGFIINLKDVYQTRKAIMSLKNSKKLRKKFGEAGLKKIIKENSYEYIGEKLREAIQESLEIEKK